MWKLINLLLNLLSERDQALEFFVFRVEVVDQMVDYDGLLLLVLVVILLLLLKRVQSFPVLFFHS